MCKRKRIRTRRNSSELGKNTCFTPMCFKMISLNLPSPKHLKKQNKNWWSNSRGGLKLEVGCKRHICWPLEKSCKGLSIGKFTSGEIVSSGQVILRQSKLSRFRDDYRSEVVDFGVFRDSELNWRLSDPILVLFCQFVFCLFKCNACSRHGQPQRYVRWLICS